MTRVVVDADYLVYSIGFAVERVLYDLSVLRPDGELVELVCRYKDQVDAFLSDEPPGYESVLEERVEADPLSHALFLVDRTLTSLDSALTDNGVEFDKLHLYLTGKGNFRDEIATIKGYKANRVGARKPVHYAAIRRYLRNRWGAMVVDGYEADDAVAMEAYAHGYDPNKLLIVSMDKDLRTVPGGHFHFRKRKVEVLTEEDARVNFYRQLITGDVVDNVGGAYKAGQKAAETAIKHGMTEEAMCQNALALYAKYADSPKCPYKNLGPYAALRENGKLLHMYRSTIDVWEPPITDPGLKSESATS